MAETITPPSRRALHQGTGLKPSPQLPSPQLPAWATGRRHEGVSRPSREPQLAQLFPGSRPIPVVYSPRAGVDLLTASRPNSPAAEPPAAPPTATAPSAKTRTEHAPRVAGPRIAAPSRPLPTIQAPVSAAVAAVLAGATVRQSADTQRSQPVPPPSRDDPLTGTLPGSVLAPRVEGGPSLARPHSAPLSTGFSTGFSDGVGGFAGPALPASRRPVPAAAHDADDTLAKASGRAQAPGLAKATPTAAPPYRPSTVNPISAVPDRPAAVGLSEPDWAAFDFGAAIQPKDYSPALPSPAAPPSQPVPVVPPQPNLSGRPVAVEPVGDSFALTQPPVYATGSIQAIAAPIRRNARPAPIRQEAGPGVGAAALDLFDPFSSGTPQPNSVGALTELGQPSQVADVEPFDLAGIDSIVNAGGFDGSKEGANRFGGDYLDVGFTGDPHENSQSVEEVLVDPFGLAPPVPEPLPDLDMEADPESAFELGGPVFSPVVPPVSDPLMADLEAAPVPDPEPVVVDEEAMWEPPPALLPDGRGPWLVGPEADRQEPKGGSSRLIVRAVFVVLAGIAVGAAIWAVTYFLSSGLS